MLREIDFFKYRTFFNLWTIFFSLRYPCKINIFLSKYLEILIFCIIMFKTIPYSIIYLFSKLGISILYHFKRGSVKQILIFFIFFTISGYQSLENLFMFMCYVLMSFYVIDHDNKPPSKSQQLTTTKNYVLLMSAFIWPWLWLCLRMWLCSML